MREAAPIETTVEGRGGTATSAGALPAILHVRRGHVRWWTEERWWGLLLGERAPDWFALDRDPRASRLKSGHRRGVWRVELDGRLFYAKVRRCPRTSLRETLLRWLRTTAAEREWRISRAAAERGVPVVRMIAVGVRGRGRPGTVLISEALPDAVPLSRAWGRCSRLTGRAGRAARSAIIGAVARMYARAHRIGLYHPDNHPQNLVVSGGDHPQCFMLDLPAAKLRRRPCHSDVIRNLAQLEHHFRRIATRADRLRFLRLHADNTIGSLNPRDRRVVRLLVQDILAARSAHAADLARRRDRRIRRNGKYFATLRLPDGWRATVVLKLERRHVFPEPHVADREIIDWVETLRVLATGPSRDSAPKSSLLQLCFQGGLPVGWWQGLTWTLLGPPQSKLFARCHQLRHRDIPAPLPLAYIVHRSPFGVVDRAWLAVPRPANEAARQRPSNRRAPRKSSSSETS